MWLCFCFATLRRYCKVHAVIMILCGIFQFHLKYLLKQNCYLQLLRNLAYSILTRFETYFTIGYQLFTYSQIRTIVTTTVIVK